MFLFVCACGANAGSFKTFVYVSAHKAFPFNGNVSFEDHAVCEAVSEFAVSVFVVGFNSRNACEE
ncbi:MAG: hypothetical protein LRY51_10580 [Geovibrio sp.]|nr:hypothetical protein [Geovibrio sp.]